MNKSIFLLCILLLPLMGIQNKKQLLEPEDAISLLKTIQDEAIVLGKGDIEVHTFIDPLCVMSQRYLARLYKTKEVLSKYTIYLYFHEIKKKKSHKHILNIIDAEFREEIMNKIMLKKEMASLKDIENESSKKLCDKISMVAKKIGVNKRPYIIINGKAK